MAPIRYVDGEGGSVVEAGPVRPVRGGHLRAQAQVIAAHGLFEGASADGRDGHFGRADGLGVLA
ncbi:hypothetical protein ACTG9Q_24575 [Actinokineospora sp. 24-640]